MSNEYKDWLNDQKEQNYDCDLLAERILNE